MQALGKGVEDLHWLCHPCLSRIRKHAALETKTLTCDFCSSWASSVHCLLSNQRTVPLVLPPGYSAEEMEVPVVTQKLSRGLRECGICLIFA